MLRRHLALFSLFSAIAVVAVLLIAAYQGWMGARLQAYVAQITKCAYLSVERCATHPLCQGDYAADPRYPEELIFRACKAKTAEQLKTASNTAKLCRRSGGSWDRTPYGEYCQCPSGLRYAPASGCQPGGPGAE